MKQHKYIILITILFLITGCQDVDTKENLSDKASENEVAKGDSSLTHYTEALTLFEEGMEAEVYDIETGISYKVRRVEGGFQSIADVETITLEDTNKLLESAGGTWNIIRRAVIVTIGDEKIAASIAPFYHSGSEDYPYGQFIDDRTGATGSGINLDSIRDNGMIGVVDIYFHNSLIPGLNRIDERHQEMVLKAYEY